MGLPLATPTRMITCLVWPHEETSRLVDLAVDILVSHPMRAEESRGYRLYMYNPGAEAL